MLQPQGRSYYGKNNQGLSSTGDEHGAAASLREIWNRTIQELCSSEAYLGRGTWGFVPTHKPQVSSTLRYLLHVTCDTVIIQNIRAREPCDWVTKQKWLQKAKSHILSRLPVLWVTAFIATISCVSPLDKHKKMPSLGASLVLSLSLLLLRYCFPVVL